MRLPDDCQGHIYNQFVIRCEVRDRNALRTFLEDNGVGTEIYYPVSLPMQVCFAEPGHTPRDFPHAEAVAREGLALPIWPELTAAQQEYVVDRINAYYRR